MTDTITLTSPDEGTVAELVPDLNLLVSSLAIAGTELLDPTHGLGAYEERGATMGIPLLYPWANRLERFGYEAAGKRVELADDAPVPTDPNGLPIHGVQPRLLRWTVDTAGPGTVTARLTWSTRELLELFPFEHELSSTVTVQDGGLSIATTLRATGADSVPVSFGYHPYLRPAAGHRQEWDVSLGARRHLELDDRMLPTGAGEPLATPEFTLAEVSLDDAYDGVEPGARFAATAGADGVRSGVEVRFERGFPYAQVYAPPAKEFICFEPMTAPGNALCSGRGLTVVAPGESYQAEFSLSVTLP